MSIFCVVTIIFQHCLNPLGHGVHKNMMHFFQDSLINRTAFILNSNICVFAVAVGQFNTSLLNKSIKLSVLYLPNDRMFKCKFKKMHTSYNYRFSADNLSQIVSETLLVMHVKTDTQPWHPTEIHLWNSPILTVCEMSVGFICFVSRHLLKLEDLQCSRITHKSLTLHTYMLKWPSLYSERVIGLFQLLSVQYDQTV